MMQFREKWIWALCFAVLIHAVFFFIFYFNMNKTKTAKIANKDIDTVQPITTSNVKQHSIDTAYATTITNTKPLEDINNNLNPTDNSDQKQITNKPKISIKQTTHLDNTKIPSSKTSTALRTSNSIADDMVSANSHSQEATQKNKAVTQKNKPITTQKNGGPQSTIADADEHIENAENTAGLLDIDVPSTVHIDDNHIPTKYDVNAINRQLSDAINEVKKRNQQTIDERQQSLKSKPIKEDDPDFVEQPK